MTIDQLIQELQRHRDQHGGSCRVLMTWEGTVRELAPANIYPEAAADLWDGPTTTAVSFVERSVPGSPHPNEVTSEAGSLPIRARPHLALRIYLPLDHQF